MKRAMFGMMLVGALAVGAQAMLLDSMDNIAGTQWVEVRGSGLMVQSSFSHDGGGSMEMLFSQATGSTWDLVPQRYFYGPNPPVNNSVNNGLDFTNPNYNTLTFWMYKAVATDRERVVQVLLYDAYGTPGPARLTVTEPTVAGWTKVTLKASDATFDTQALASAFHWDYVQTFQFWTSTYNAHGGDLYIDDLQVVPEPMTMSLLGLGALVLRKRK